MTSSGFVLGYCIGVLAGDQQSASWFLSKERAIVQGVSIPAAQLSIISLN
jgi:hypothetical protein